MKLELLDADTGKPDVLEVNEWRLLAALQGAAPSFRFLTSAHVLAALLSNPEYRPAKEEAGDTHAQACVREAVACADLLLAELERTEPPDCPLPKPMQSQEAPATGKEKPL